MEHGKKLLELLGVASLREYVEPTTYEELMETGSYYGDLFKEAFDRGEVHSDRIQNVIARLLAEALQQEARNRYGAADAAAIRRLAAETFEADANKEMDRQMDLLREGIVREGLNPEQQSAFLREMERFKERFIDVICAEAARMKLIPLENASEVSLAVAEMMREEGNANNVSDN